MKSLGGCLLKCLLWFAGVAFWILGVGICGIGGAIFAGLPVLYLCYRIYRRSQAQISQRATALSDYATALYHLPEKDLLRACVADALLLRTNDHSQPVALRTVKLRTLLTAVFLVLNFVIIHLFYYKSSGLILCSVLALAYTIVLCRLSTLNTLCRMAKKNPDTDFDQLIRQNTFNSLESPVCKHRATLGLVVYGLSLVAFFAMHATAQWHYTAVDGGYRLDRYRPAIIAEADLTIPGTYNGQPVLCIGESAFAEQPQLLSVTIPDTVLSIEKQAFSGCTLLNRVTLSQSLRTIGVGAFADCNFASISLPDSLTELLAESFQNCDELTEITIPQGVTEIRASTFYSCNALKDVHLHDGILDIHANAFQNCSALVSIELPGSITEIHAYTFENCSSLRAIDIPNGVTRIAAHAFYGCSKLQRASIPLSVTEIRSSAFRLCPNLKSVTVAQDTVIHEKAFKESPTKVLRDSLTSYQWNAAVEETRKKDVEFFYYVVSDTQQLVTYNNSKFVLLFDDPSGQQELKDGESLEKANDDTAMIAYLEKAQKAGVTHAQIALISPSATKVVKSPRFIYYTWDIAELIQLFRDEVAANG